MPGKQFCYHFGIFLMTHAFCSASDLKLLNVTTYSVIIGEQQTVIIPYSVVNDSSGTTTDKIQVEKLAAAPFKSYYDIRDETNITGYVYLHFLKVKEKDLGNYLLYINEANKHEISISAVPAPIDIYKILLYVLPAILFVVACVAVVFAFVTVRRKRSFGAEKKKPKVKKNPYVKSGAGLPAGNSVSRPKSSDAQVPIGATHVNTVSKNNSFAPPVVTQRTTSLHPSINQHDVPPMMSPAVQFHRQGLNRQSMNSIDSFDDTEDEYENTCQLQLEQPLPPSFHRNPPVNKQASRLADNNPYLASKPISSPPINRNMKNLQPSHQPTSQRFPSFNRNQQNMEIRNIRPDVMPSKQPWPVQKYPPHPTSPKPNSNFSNLQVDDDVYDEVSLG